ncbi:MAG: deoxyguanosinetriphosphate triphosphohydrolase [Ignavibacteria bacterium]
MNWEQLLSRTRPGEENPQTINNINDGRSEFQRDFDRIVFSSAFRRLQDKTQVFPLPESNFVHNRLTHSLEVSCIGRSLGNIVGERVLNKRPELQSSFTKFHFGEIVAAACLAHDIGNPPFGHSGEDAIAEYFKFGNGAQFESLLNFSPRWNDFTKFEGNAQGFRIIVCLQNPNVIGGLRLTAATLAAFTKYPKESFIETSNFNLLQAEQQNKIYKKYGFFQSEKDFFIQVAKEVGLSNKSQAISSLFMCRHPLSFLVEAADDICYRVMDLEDGFHLGLVSFKETEDLLRALAGDSELKSYSFRDKNDRIGYLRAKALNNLVYQLADIFTDEEDNILKGSLDNELINLLPAARILKEIKDISIEKIYSYESVLEREAAGFEVLGGLLDIFITAVTETANNSLSGKHKKILQLLPDQFISKNGQPGSDLYTRLLKITDFISGMTDSFAISLFRKIKGISMANK